MCYDGIYLVGEALLTVATRCECFTQCSRDKSVLLVCECLLDILFGTEVVVEVLLLSLAELCNLAVVLWQSLLEH